MATSNSNNGRFVWYEDLAKDPKAAIDFYSYVVGWKTQPFTQKSGRERHALLSQEGSADPKGPRERRFLRQILQSVSFGTSPRVIFDFVSITLPS